MRNFEDKFAKGCARAQEVVERFLPKEEGEAGQLIAAMRYAVLGTGKRLRPLLLWESFQLLGGEGDLCEPFMAALEYIHTHSLIHDDLPALDNDDYRRGRLTTHKVFGEAMGVLSGDALLNHAYEVMAKAAALDPSGRSLLALEVIARKTGWQGMLGGQCVDVLHDGKEVTQETLWYIYEKKTSALLEAPLMAGALLAGAGEDTVRAMERVGTHLGLAFQIQDDLLDETSTQEVLGKPIHSDAKNKKTTYVSLYGQRAARERVEEESKRAIEALREGALSLGEIQAPLEKASGDPAVDPEGLWFLTELILRLAHREK